MAKRPTDQWKKRAVSGRLGRLRSKLSRRFARERDVVVSDKLVNQAVLEAEALAWTTACPLLVFPLLAQEKVETLYSWVRGQSNVQAGEPLEMAPLSLPEQGHFIDGASWRGFPDEPLS